LVAVVPAAPEAPVILLVDDEPIVRTVFRNLLIRAGYRVIEAGDGVEALVRLGTTGAISLLLTDASMPRMDGAMLITRVRSAWPRLPIIMVTGHEGVDAPGADLVLEKPLRGHALLAAVAGLLDGVASRASAAG
jgi:CheY-like chemotaxis protein